MCCREVYCVRRCVSLCRCVSGWVPPSMCISVRLCVSLAKADGREQRDGTWVETETLQGKEVPNSLFQNPVPVLLGTQSVNSAQAKKPGRAWAPGENSPATYDSDYSPTHPCRPEGRMDLRAPPLTGKKRTSARPSSPAPRKIQPSLGANIPGGRRN